MIPDEDNLGAYVRYLRDRGLTEAVGDWRERGGVREFGVRVGGVFYSVAELRDEGNRAAVLALDFEAVQQRRAAAAVKEAAGRTTRQRARRKD